MFDDDSSYLDDWTFHQATGLVAAHVGTHDMGEAAMHLLALARRRHESTHTTAVLIVKGEIVLGERAGRVEYLGWAGGFGRTRWPFA